jgi:spermidine/putrescine transport system substrate-binding protein
MEKLEIMGAARTLRRRTLLQVSATTGLAVVAAPWVMRHARAAGEINVFAWGDYVQAFNEDGIVKAFEDKTGTKVNLSTYGSNEECENKLRAAGGKGFDIIFPSVDTGPNYYKDGLLTAIDETKLEVAQILPAMYRNSVTLGATQRGKRYLVPFDWGTEAVTWDAERYPDLGYGTISYGHLFEGDAKAAMRQKSIFAGIALYLDATGALPSNRGMDYYKSEADSRRVFDGCLKFLIEHKQNIGAWWNNATEATSAFTDAGCTIGQTWDTTGILLGRNNGAKWRYTMPKEGGLAWMDTVAIPSGAGNPDGAYAFINHLLTPEMGAVFSNRTGYNSAAKGADQFLNEQAKAAFEMAYPDQAALDNLFWWPMQTDFYAQLRGEYVEKLTNA